MPIIGIPITPSSPLSNLQVKAATPSSLYGEEVITRRPGVHIFAGSTNDFSVALIDEAGNHIVGDETFTYTCRYAEGVQRTVMIAEAPGTILDVDYAIVGFNIPASVSQYPGVYIASVGIFVSNVLRHVHDIWIYNEPSVWMTSPTEAALPPIKDVQLLLRDSSPVENEVLNSRQFGIEEFAQAAVDTVSLWNDIPPFLGDLTTINFPSRAIYLRGMKHFLFEMLVEWYRKNRLAYNAGGMAVDDMSKFQEYMAASQKEEQDLRIMIQRTKSTLNLADGFAKLG